MSCAAKERVGESADQQKLDCALGFKPDHVVGAEEVVEEFLGLLADRLCDAAFSNGDAARLQVKLDKSLRFRKGNIVDSRHCEAALGVKTGDLFAKLSVQFSRVFLCHRAAAFVVFTSTSSVEYRTLAFAHNKLSKEHVSTVLSAVRNLFWHRRPASVLGLLLSHPSLGTFCDSGCNVKFRARNLSVISPDSDALGAGRDEWPGAFA